MLHIWEKMLRKCEEDVVGKELSKDLKRVEEWGDKRWVFKESTLIGDKAAFKNKIKDALMPNGVVCDEIATNFQADKAKFAKALGLQIDELPSPQSFIVKLMEDQNFDRMFFRSNF